MNRDMNERGSFELTTSIAIFLVCLIIALSVAAFHHWYFPSKYLEFKSTEITNLFNNSENFSKKAKQILNTRDDVSYIKLLDRDGVVEHSFGTADNEKSEKYFLNAPSDKTIIVGIKHIDYNQIDGFSLLWSFIIGSVVSLLLLLVIFIITPSPDESIRRLLDSMKKLNEGDLSTRLAISPSVQADTEILGLYNEFNTIASNFEQNAEKTKETEVLSIDNNDVADDITKVTEDKIAKDSEKIMNLGEAEIVEDTKEKDKKEEEIEKPIVQETKKDETPKEDLKTDLVEKDKEKETENVEIITITDEDILGDDNKYDNFSLFSDENKKSEKIEAKTKKKIEEQLEKVKEVKKEIKKEIIKPFRPKLVSNNGINVPKNRNVTALVAKISDFENITSKFDPSDLNSFITNYRNSATKIIADYGGTVEALFQDEIVAIFNAPKKQTNPELRSVSVAVEIMQLVADITRKRKSEGKKMISAKIGIGVDSVPFNNDIVVPGKVKDVVERVRSVCESSDNWKILVSTDFYNSIKDYVDVKEEKVNNSSYYSITGVEEGVANL